MSELALEKEIAVNFLDSVFQFVSTKQAVEPLAKLLATEKAKARLEQLMETPHYSGCATLYVTRNPYPPCDCWVGNQIAALRAAAQGGGK